MDRWLTSTVAWILSLLASAAVAFLAAAPATAATTPGGAPAELKVGYVDFFSGAAAPFGISGKNVAEWLVDKWNKEGGIRGVKLKLVMVDEAGGPDKQVTEYRRLVLDEAVDAVVGYTSSPTPVHFLHPDPEAAPLQKEFVEGMKARFGRYPDYPTYRTYQALAGLKAPYEKAIEQAGGRWPETDDVVKAFEDLSWQVPFGTITMRSDHQAVHGASSA